jgi:hypothetical protein
MSVLPGSVNIAVISDASVAAAVAPGTAAVAFATVEPICSITATFLVLDFALHNLSIPILYKKKMV